MLVIRGLPLPVRLLTAVCLDFIYLMKIKMILTKKSKFNIMMTTEIFKWWGLVTATTAAYYTFSGCLQLKLLIPLVK